MSRDELRQLLADLADEVRDIRKSLGPIRLQFGTARHHLDQIPRTWKAIA